jgi:hypothetical protein
MRVKILFLLVALALLVSSCKVSQQVNQLKTNAQAAYDAADYKTAFHTYDSLITLQTNRGKEIDGNLYRKAGIAAWLAGEVQKTIDYTEKAKEKGAANSLSYLYIAKAYLSIDNLSREIINLSTYIEKYPDGSELTEVRNLLFLAYVKSENWQPALELWQLLPEDKNNNPAMLTGYLKTMQKVGSSRDIFLTAEKLLKIDSKSNDAIEALAIELYNIAEESYQAEMKAYQKNRTNRQYKQLLDALEIINANFQKSRDYFERLYKVNPDPRYATFLGNIYTRFDNKQRADYYYRKAKQ